MLVYSRKVVLTIFILLSSKQVFADAEEKSEEVTEGNKPTENGEFLGPPDSHEAMNNREINPTMREKRSYEFLMGLINNNSKYEVTKVDPTELSRQPQNKITASELLLELMVKIAAHPDHWNRVHSLLQKIDSDLLASRKIVNNLQSTKLKNNDNSEERIPISYKKVEFIENKKSNTNKWPIFKDNNNNINNDDDNDDDDGGGDDDDDDDNETTTAIFKDKIINTKINNDFILSNNKIGTYPKSFAYHRVTGRPLHLNNKNPKAYIAVSVIGPKNNNNNDNNNNNNNNNNLDDLNLENELRQLKPWIHTKNTTIK